MSYEYCGNLYSTPRQASHAAVADWLYAGGHRSNNFVAGLAKYPTHTIAKEMREQHWIVPFLDEHNQSLEEIIKEIIYEAQEGFLEDWHDTEE